MAIKVLGKKGKPKKKRNNYSHKTDNPKNQERHKNKEMEKKETSTTSDIPLMESKGILISADKFFKNELNGKEINLAINDYTEEVSFKDSNNNLTILYFSECQLNESIISFWNHYNSEDLLEYVFENIYEEDNIEELLEDFDSELIDKVQGFIKFWKKVENKYRYYAIDEDSENIILFK